MKFSSPGYFASIDLMPSITSAGGPQNHAFCATPSFSDGVRDGAPGVQHLGIQVEDQAELTEVYDRLRRAERPTLEQQNTTCCYARSDKQWIADTAQREHVPSFPLRDVAEHLDTPQMRHRRYYRAQEFAGKAIRAPGPPFGLSVAVSDPKQRTLKGPMPLSGVRVLDFSWVIAGPTTTRYLAAMGAEVIKVEAPEGDLLRNYLPMRNPGMSGNILNLHRNKRAIVLDLKSSAAKAALDRLIKSADVFENRKAFGENAAARERDPVLRQIARADPPGRIH